MRRTIVARTADEIFSLRHFWHRLEEMPSATMFQSFKWNYLAARFFAGREAPFVVYSADDSSEVLIPAAINLSSPRLTMLGETLFDYRDVLSSPDGETQLSAWNRLSELGLNVSVAGIRNETNFASKQGFDLSRHYGAPCVSPAAITPVGFAGAHGRLGRWKRRLEREGAELKCRTGENSELVRFIYGQKGKQPAESGDNLFLDPLRQQFMIEICRTLGPICEIFTIETAGTLIAAIVTFRDHDVRRFYTVYFDQRWARYSPGMVLLYEVTCRSLQAALQCDYMTGEHPYKMRFATSVVPMYCAKASADALRIERAKEAIELRAAS